MQTITTHQAISTAHNILHRLSCYSLRPIFSPNVIAVIGATETKGSVGRTVFQHLGRGGYHVENTVRAWVLAWRTCLGGGDEDAMSIGLGGVMLGSADWVGGLRDRHLPVTAEQRAAVDSELHTTNERVIRKSFPYHGFTPQPDASSAATLGG